VIVGWMDRCMLTPRARVVTVPWSGDSGCCVALHRVVPGQKLCPLMFFG
jgi:hypothetical protein